VLLVDIFELLALIGRNSTAMKSYCNFCRISMNPFEALVEMIVDN
jgi:hypothetical protein